MLTPTPSPQTAVVTIPYWSSTFAFGGTTYSYKMVGSNPMSSSETTTVPVSIIPVQLDFSNGISLNPTAAAATVGDTPLFATGTYASGRTQYGDAFMRAQFWKYTANSNYHVLLGTPVLEPTVRIAVPESDGFTSTTAGFTTGYVTYGWFVQTVEPQLIAQMGIDPRSLTIVATYNTKVLEPGGACCYAGYHSAFALTTSYGPSIATTAWASVVVNGVETLSHEIGEWLDDPFYTNTVPSWINPINGACNGNLLEVGDPVTNYVFSVNNRELQDLAFYSWFSRDQPSLGFNGVYDLMGRLKAPAASCGG
jgi:hypothetical protein